MRSPKRLASLTGYRAQKRPKVLVAMNQNEVDGLSTDPSFEEWERIGEIADRLARRRWLDE